MTKSEHLFALLGDLDDDLVEEAARPIPASRPKPVRHWARWGALCACLLLAVGLWNLSHFRMGSSGAAPNNAVPPGSSGFTGEGVGSTEPPSGDSGSDPAAPADQDPSSGNVGGSDGEVPTLNGLPILSWQGPFAESGGGTSLLVSAGDDAALAVQDYLSDAIDLPEGAAALPVYQSTIERYGSGTPVSSDEAAMEAMLDDVLARLGLTQAECKVTRTTSEGADAAGTESVSLMYLEAAAPDGTTATVRYDLTYCVYLPVSALPQSLLNSDTSTPEGTEALGQAILDELGWLLDMDDPRLLVTGGGVKTTGEPDDYSLTIYDGLDDPCRVTQSRVSTWGHSGGEQGLVLNFDPRMTQALVGEYPIITMEEARAQLLTGEWSYDGYVPAETDIYRSELVYRTDVNGLTMPCYCFYLEKGVINDSAREIECRYLPAVAVQYLDLSSRSGSLGNS